MTGTFPLGSIPPLSVWEGETLNFKVTSKLGAGVTYTMRATPAPSGRMSIDEKSGVFTYAPLSSDRDEIAFAIRASNGAKEETQTVAITPHPRLPTEFRIIRHEANPPKRSDYLTFIEQKDADKRVFNNTLDYEDQKKVEIQTSHITISGIDLVLERNSKTNLLFDRLQPSAGPRTNLTRLTLCAETVTIRSELHLPGTQVEIYARLLRFENASDSDKGAIKTTPFSVETKASKRDEALKGQNAGDVRLYVEKIEISGPGPRIIARGGNGQPGREGTPGEKGHSVTQWDGKITKVGVELNWNDDIQAKAPGFTPLFAKVFAHTPLNAMWEEDGTVGQNDWPSDGKPPQKLPGFPGQSGNGGSVFTSFPDQLKSVVELRAGEPGQKAANVDPSEAGSPPKSCHVTINYKVWAIPPFDPARSGESAFVRRDSLNINEKREAHKGPGAIAPGPNPSTAAGKAGLVSPLAKEKGGPGYWLHPATIRALLAYGNDGWMSGSTDDARKLLASYRDAIAAASLHKGDNIEWSALHGDLASLIERIDGPYDYFGNPAGWVPLLSLESNLKLYQAEINSAIRTMFFAYWMENIQKSNESSTTALTNALKQLQEEAEKARNDYNAALTKLSDIEGRINTLNPDIDAFYVSLKNLEQELEKNTRNDLQLEHTLRSTGKLLGGVMQLIPVGQPMLGAFGKGLTALSDIDLDKPFDTVPEVLGAFSEVAKQKLKPKAEELFNKFKTYLNEEDEKSKTEEKKEHTEKKSDPEKEEFEKSVKKKELAEKVKKFMDDQKEAKSQAIAAFKGYAVPEDEVKERLARAKAECPQYQGLIKQLEPLNAKKTALMQDTLAALKTIDEATATILYSQFARIELQVERDKKLEELSAGVFQYAQSMGQRARHRLLKYQYYLLKSYQFLMVQDLPSLDFRAQKMFDEFTNYVPGKSKLKPGDDNYLPPSENGDLSEKHFKRLSAVFEDQLRGVVNTIIDFYESSSPKYDGKFGVIISPAQLKILNERGRLDIDLMQMGYHDFDREDIRIINIELHELKLAKKPTTGLVNISLTYRHEGVSRLRRGGKLYLFRAGRYRVADDGKDVENSLRDAKFYWGTDVIYRAEKDNYEITHRKPDAVEKWLVNHLLGEKETRDTSPLTSYRPSAWARLTITLSSTPDRNAGKLDGLELTVGYASHNLNERLGTVFVRTANEIEPLIRCDKTDVNGLADGQGSFLRTFDVTQTPRVTLHAPSRYGGRKFEGWLIDQRSLQARLAQDNAGALWWVEGEEVARVTADKLDPSPSLVLDLTNQTDYTVEPHYSDPTIPLQPI
jgi:hypothetical protein